MTENKRFNVFDVDGTIFLEDHKEGSYHIGEIRNVDVNCLNDIASRLNELAEENRKLKEGIYPVNIDIISMALVTSFAESYVTLVKLDQELERMGFSKTNMQRIKIRNKMKRKFESMLFEFIHWSRIKGVF